jgi:prephenate dehydrogenase
MNQLTIIGTGLIGGSFALAIKQAGFRGRVIGCDRRPVLDEALRLGAIDNAIEDPVSATRGSDLILLATPVGAIIDVLEMAPLFPRDALITDVGSTKCEIMARARDVFGGSVIDCFLPGHPMAGKEHSGVAEADPNLFREAAWLFTPYPGQKLETGRAGEYVALVKQTGARVLVLTDAQDSPDTRRTGKRNSDSYRSGGSLAGAERHDRLCAWVSHLPQMLATALAASLEDEFGDDPDLQAIGGRALREMTRIGASPYSMWRDVALTNTANIQEAMLRLEQRMAHIRENLRTRGLQEEFERANAFRAKP